MAKHIEMHQGDAYAIPITLTQNREPLAAELLAELEISVGSNIVRYLSDGGVMQQDGDTDYYIKLSRNDTRKMRPGQYDVAARATYRGVEENSLVIHIGRITILPAHY